MCRELRHSGGPGLLVLNPHSVFSCFSSATDGGDAPSVSGFLIGFLSVLPSGEKRLVGGFSEIEIKDFCLCFVSG